MEKTREKAKFCGNLFRRFYFTSPPVALQRFQGVVTRLVTPSPPPNNDFAEYPATAVKPPAGGLCPKSDIQDLWPAQAAPGRIQSDKNGLWQAPSRVAIVLSNLVRESARAAKWALPKLVARPLYFDCPIFITCSLTRPISRSYATIPQR